MGRGAITFRKEDDMPKGARWIMALTLLLGGLVGVPTEARAAECTDAFEQCLNDTYDRKGLYRLMADIECTAEYIGCVRRKM